MIKSMVALPLQITFVQVLFANTVCAGFTKPQYPLFEEFQEPSMAHALDVHLTAGNIPAQNVLATDYLLPFILEPLPLGSIKPFGWLADQLQLMSAGLAGHEYDFYNYVAHSSWLGGAQEYSTLNEGFPYWFNGLVPLAYSLDDPRLKDQVHSAASYVLEHQSDDGWIGPETGTARNFWARYPLLLGMSQLVEANATWETPVVDSLHRFVQLMHTMLADNYTGYIYHDGDNFDPGNVQWGQVRAHDLIITLQWLYENYPRNNSEILLDNMYYLYDKSFKWEAWYNEAVYLKQDLWTVPDAIAVPDFPYEHGVNVGQGLKAPAVIYRFTHNSSLLITAMDGVNWTFAYHGNPAGTVIADERLGGLSPYSGSELCTVVETMYSLSYLYQALGTADYADRAELAAFNALPAMLTPDWWAHQYVQQTNQPWSQSLVSAPFWNVKNVGQTFGLEPDYPCCTVNHPQGFPKFLAATFVRVGDNGLGHALLSPATVTTELASSNVTITCVTDYPFSGQLSYIVTADAPFDFYVRVPAWYVPSLSNVQVGNDTINELSPDATTGLHKVSLPAGNSTIQYNIGAIIRVDPRANDTVAIYRGALLYALEIGSINSSTLPKNYYSEQEYPEDYAPPQARDWTMANTSIWNIAIDPSTLQFYPTSDSNTTSLPNPVFAPGAPPVHMTVEACEIEWDLIDGSTPGPAPPSEERGCVGPTFVATLTPYGSAKLHMAELPTIDLAAFGYQSPD